MLRARATLAPLYALLSRPPPYATGAWTDFANLPTDETRTSANACALLNEVGLNVAELLGGRPIYEQLLERTLRLAGQPVPPADGETLPVQLGWESGKDEEPATDSGIDTRRG